MLSHPIVRALLSLSSVITIYVVKNKYTQKIMAQSSSHSTSINEPLIGVHNLNFLLFIYYFFILKNKNKKKKIGQ